LRVGEYLVETLARIHTRVVRQPERKLPDGPEFLYLRPLLVQPRLAGDRPLRAAVAVRSSLNGCRRCARGRRRGSRRWPASGAGCPSWQLIPPLVVEGRLELAASDGEVTLGDGTAPHGWGQTATTLGSVA